MDEFAELFNPGEFPVDRFGEKIHDLTRKRSHAHRSRERNEAEGALVEEFFTRIQNQEAFRGRQDVEKSHANAELLR